MITDQNHLSPLCPGKISKLSSRSLYRDRAQQSAPHSHTGSLGRIRRIQGTCSTRSTTPFWLACYLVPSYSSCGMECSCMCLSHVFRAKFTALWKESTTHRLADLYERDIRAKISWIPCIAWIEQAMLFRCITSLAHRPHI
jgi:hypothetical protein